MLLGTLSKSKVKLLGGRSRVAGCSKILTSRDLLCRKFNIWRENKCQLLEEAAQRLKKAKRSSWNAMAWQLDYNNAPLGHQWTHATAPRPRVITATGNTEPASGGSEPASGGSCQRARSGPASGGSEPASGGSRASPWRLSSEGRVCLGLCLGQHL